MYVSKIKNHYKKHRKIRLCQGDIFRDLNVSIGVASGKKLIAIDFELPYSVLMTQDCDLQSDYNERKKKEGGALDKQLRTFLLCPAFPANSFFEGKAVSGYSTRLFYKKEREKVQNNKEFPRYHFLEGNTEIGIPPLVVDFKQYITILSDALYMHRKDTYIATLSELFRERLSQRFANYLSRIGLPELKTKK